MRFREKSEIRNSLANPASEKQKPTTSQNFHGEADNISVEPALRIL
ncbi:MAG TPA: hypothetical protein VIM94_00950 [Salegentibacter sp.]